MTASMPMPTLYHIPKTISSPLVQCLLELNLVNTVVNVREITFADLKKPEYLAINPMGTSPAFRDGAIVLWESGAILSYLLERYDPTHKLYPPSLSIHSTPHEISSRAKCLQLQQYIIATVYPFMACLYIHTFKPIGEQDAEYIASARIKWNTLFGPVLAKWLGEGPYFIGERLCAIDFLIAKPLKNSNAMGLLANFPTLLSLLERITARPSFAAAYEGPIQSMEQGEPSQKLLLIPTP